MYHHDEPLKSAILAGLHSGGTGCDRCDLYDMYKPWSKFGVKWSSESQSTELKQLSESEICYNAHGHHIDGLNTSRH